MSELRWKERFEQFEKALTQLDKALAIPSPNEVYRAGIIQIFEFTFELSWKTLKDYLSWQGFDVKSPRQTIKQAFQNELIEDGHKWIDALEKRNLMAHTYNEEASKKAEQLIRDDYHPLFQNLQQTMKSML